MPTFNSGDFTLEAVESAVSQMRAGDELLIQDGVSTDGSIVKVASRYGSHPGVKIVSQPDGGQADALNRALARAGNPVAGWLNGDDCYYPGALDAARRGWLRDESVDLVYGSWTMYSKSGEILRVCVPGQLTRAGLMRTPQVFTGSMFMRTAMVHDIGGFDRDLHYCMDIDLVARILRRGRVPTRVPETLGGFRWHKDSKTGALGFGVVRECLQVRRRYANGFGEQLEAYVFSTTQLVSQASIPLRRSKAYVRVRDRQAARLSRS
ncbi:MAG TPA: glycosyltransferase [Acidimicrobiales bacterium]|nr:glycosyltransferase [Acidimicrobiales bacterium]